MERVYFSINEAGAKTANDMMSFSEYKTGSKTAGYKAQVDKAYELAEKVIEARPTEEERVSKLCERYSRRLAQKHQQGYSDRHDVSVSNDFRSRKLPSQKRRKSR